MRTWSDGHMKKVGVTGGIGSGKSTVCEVLRVLGVPVFNADREAKALYASAKVRNAVIDAFGERFYVGDVVDRKALADLVFGDPEALLKLNSILHPAVRQRFRSFVNSDQADEHIVFVEERGQIRPANNQERLNAGALT